VIGRTLGPYEIAALIGEGGPPTLSAVYDRQLRRGLAVAMERTSR
jgi:hypothetical protein